MKLQVNTNGAWKDVADFDKSRAAEVLEAVRMLDTALGAGRAKWCIVNDTGHRKWLEFK